MILNTDADGCFYKLGSILRRLILGSSQIPVFLSPRPDKGIKEGKHRPDCGSRAYLALASVPEDICLEGQAYLEALM